MERRWHVFRSIGGPSYSLEAYARALVANTEDRAIAAELSEEIDRFRQDSEGTPVTHLLRMKRIEYKALSALVVGQNQLLWFLKRDLLQTPATVAELKEIESKFGSSDEAASRALLATVTHLALGQWQRYADAVRRAVYVERLIFACLVGGLAFCLVLPALTGIDELWINGFHGFVRWLGNTPQLPYVVGGALGAAVGLAVGERLTAAARPLDDWLFGWVVLTRLALGMVAGVVAPFVLGVLPLLMQRVHHRAQAADLDTSVGFLVAFGGGLGGKVFFDRVAAGIWKATGL
jgi:hypothetical protein